MTVTFKTLFKHIWQSALFWAVAFFCYVIIKFYGIEEIVGVAIDPARKETILKQPLLAFTLLGLGLGIFYAVVDFFYEKYLSKKLSLGFNLLLKTFFYFIVTVFLATVATNIASKVFDLGLDTYPGWWIRVKGFWSIIFFIAIASFVFSFIKIATERFGKGVFVKMLLGRYKNPREEERIFMFLDLKDSTAIAEKLGHHQYSQFIQDCFFDLNEVVLDHSAEIYQYVGDEAVLSWPYQKGLADNNCLGVFFAFEEQRKSKESHYLEKYGVFPEFKAGLHGGPLMAAEVGFVKKELAYHGDVINTSARIQAECNKHKVTLLISEKLLNSLKLDTGSSSQFLGSVLLKGKENKINIHSVAYDMA